MKRKSTPTKIASKKTQALTIPEERATESFDLPSEVLRDPRKALFLRLYFDREGPTWGNARQSAMIAGFSQEYADVITYQKPRWFTAFLDQQNFVELAESHLREVLTLPNVSQAMGAFGPITRKIPTGKYEYKKVKGKRKKVEIMLEEPVIVPNSSIIKVKNEAAKIVLPAHDPTRYRSKDGQKNTFIFNVKQARERYNGNKDARVSKDN